MKVWTVLARTDDHSGSYAEPTIMSVHETEAGADDAAETLYAKNDAKIAAYMVPVLAQFARAGMKCPQTVSGGPVWIYHPWDLKGCPWDETRIAIEKQRFRGEAAGLEYPCPMLVEVDGPFEVEP